MKRNINVILATAILSLVLSGQCFAQNNMFYGVEKLILKDDYPQAQSACERIVSGNYRSLTKAKAYYLLGVCLLKQNRFELAREQFNSVLSSYSTSPYRDDASLGIAHTYFLNGECEAAAQNYTKFLSDFPRSELTSVARAYLGRCSGGELPGNPPPAQTLNDLSSEEYSVQVGCFSSRSNATRLRDKVASAGFDGYILDVPSDDLYHVRVGRFNNRLDAEFLEQKLKAKGYSTKVCP